MHEARERGVIVWCAIGDEGGGVAESLEPIQAALSAAGLDLHVFAVREGRFVNRAHDFKIPTTVVDATRAQKKLFDRLSGRFSAVVHPALGRLLYPREALRAALPADITTRTRVVLIRSVSALPLAAYVSERLKSATTVWYTANAISSTSRWKIRSWIYRYLRRRYRFQVLANSQYTATSFQFFGSVPWAYVPLSHEFRTAPAPVAESAPVFLSLGRVTPTKGQLEILKAFTQYRDEGGSWGLWFVGLTETDQHSQMLASEISASKHANAIRTFPYSARPRAFLARARVVIVGHRTHESFGQVAAQALATGRPIIGFGQGGFRELLEVTQFGWATETLSSADIAACMLAAESSLDLTDDRAREAAHCVQSVVGFEPLIRSLADILGDSANMT